MQFGGVQLQRNVPSVMRDGTTLFADIYCPGGTEEVPVLLMRQPYGKALASTVTYAHPVWYANQGYMVVIQDVRGRGESGGEFYPYLNEAKDGYDTVEWAARLPRSNGKVGMYGFSYQGAAQWAAASMRPPHLTAIAPAMCAADLYHGNFYPRGSLLFAELRGWAYQLARDGARRAGDAEAEAYCTRMMSNRSLWEGQLPVSDADEVLLRYFPAYYDWVGHPEFDAYWKQFCWITKESNATVPAFHIGGWYDYILDGTIQSFDLLRGGRLARGEAPVDRMLIGPWSHIPWGRKAGGADHGPAADGYVHKEMLKWFDVWLKGETDPEYMAEPAIRYYELGSGLWRTADALPSVKDGAEKLTFYPGNDGTPANGASGGGTLAAAPEGSPAAIPDVFVYDARLPMRVESYLPVDRSAVQDRYEILVYTTEPLNGEASILGEPSLTVRCQTLAGPTDLVAVLSLVTPDGKAKFLSIGRAEIDTESGKEGNEAGEATMSLKAVAVRLTSGSRLRLELTGSAFPLLARHMNGVRLSEQNVLGPEHLNMATVAVYADGISSFLELPIRAETKFHRRKDD